jgi:hypothetical protein
MVDGPWEIPFSLTPAAGTSVALSIAPVTHNGLTIQPLRLDVAPAGGGLDGQPGGARVVLRLSGLAPRMLVTDIPGFATVFVDGDGVPTARCGGGLLALVRPNGQQILPGFVQPFAQTVGPSGTTDLEALFYAPIQVGTSVTLYVDHASAQLAGTTTPQLIDGPWVFRLSTEGKIERSSGARRRSFKRRPGKRCASGPLMTSLPSTRLATQTTRVSPSDRPTGTAEQTCYRAMAPTVRLSLTAAATRSICSCVSSGYIGRERMRPTISSVTGSMPRLKP